MKVKNKILYGDEARSKILSGIEKMYRTVATALGPMGNNVAIDKGYETIVIHDGVEIAKSVILEDKYEKVGADILLQASKKQVEDVGDGTTLVVVLARNIAREANKIVAAGVNAMSLRKGLEKIRDEAIEKIKKLSTPVTKLEQKIQVATISAADKEIGKMVGETIDKIGEDGVSTVEESMGRETYVEMQEGLQIDKGWANPYLMTNPVDQTAVLEGARVLVTDMVLNDFTELLPFITEQLIPNGKTLFVIAPEFTGNVMTSFVNNKINGKLNVLCVNAPLFEDKQGALLADIATLVGATFISKDTGIKLKDIKFEHLGYAEKVVSDKDSTIITGGKGDKKKIKERIGVIRNLIKEEVSGYEVARLQERLAKLIGKVAVIKVGGDTEVEMRERKERVKDAVEATKTAVRDGVVPGGEITLLNISKEIDGDDNASKIMRNALEAPFRKLLENAGMDAGEIKERLSHDGTKGLGIDVATGEIKDMMKEGIVDPAGVLISAVYNAVSVSVQAITSEALIAYDPSEVKK